MYTASGVSRTFFENVVAFAFGLSAQDATKDAKDLVVEFSVDSLRRIHVGDGTASGNCTAPCNGQCGGRGSGGGGVVCVQRRTQQLIL